MSAKFIVKQIGDVTIIDAEGRITLGLGSSELRDLLHDLVTQGHRKFALNVADVSYIDSSGIGEMVSGSSHVRNNGGQITLVALTKRIRDLLQITKLYVNFKVFDDESAAIASFGQTQPDLYPDRFRGQGW